MCCIFPAVLERKMSMRRPREELIEQGVLKELPENGSQSVSLCVGVHVCVRGYQCVTVCLCLYVSACMYTVCILKD